MRLEDELVDEAECDGEHGAAGRHDAVSQPQPPLEVVTWTHGPYFLFITILCPLPCDPTEDGEGGSVDQGGSGPEHQAVGEVEARAGVEDGDAAAGMCV